MQELYHQQYFSNSPIPVLADMVSKAESTQAFEYFERRIRLVVPIVSTIILEIESK